MKHKKTFLVVVTMLMVTTSVDAQDVPAARIYRTPLDSTRGYGLWIVDGNGVRREVYAEFVYGGNDQRYRFIPQDEIWIDQSLSAEEYVYTREHEILERSLMAQCRMSYTAAHDSALVLERSLRTTDFQWAKTHEQSRRMVRPMDCDGEKEIPALQDSIRLHNVYRCLYGERDGIEIWIVDGATVRREIFPDFGFSGNDLAYQFIPEKEIWIDGQVSCEETEFSIAQELVVRDLMSRGEPYDSAYEQALILTRTAKKAAFDRAASHPAVKIPVPPEREFGENPK